MTISHFRTNHICATCGQRLDSAWVVVEGMPRHEECMSDKEQSKCPRCGGLLRAGKAFRNLDVVGMPDFIGQEDLIGQTITQGAGDAVLVNVEKCQECGYSRTI